MKEQNTEMINSTISDPLLGSHYGGNNSEIYKSYYAETGKNENKPKKHKSVSYSLDFEDMIRFKTNIKRNIILSSTLLLILIIQRPFTSSFITIEDDFIIFLQKTFPITSPSNIFSILISVLNQYPNLILSHIFVTMYYLSRNPLLTVKIMLVEYIGLMVISIVENVASDPRPFWNTSEITAGFCEASFPYPSSHVVAYYFVLTYGTFVYFHIYEKPSLNARIWSWIAYIFVFLILYLEVLAGLLYNFQLLFSIFYTILTTYIVMYFDKSITTLIEKSTIEVQSAKRSTVFWLIFVILMWTLATAVYSASSPYTNVIWYENLFACFSIHGETNNYENIAFGNLLGSWRSYTKTTYGFCWIGIVFGVAKTFRDFNGVMWYKRSFKKRAKMAFVANLFIIPAWILDIWATQNWSYMTTYSSASYLFGLVQAVLLNFFIYGILPFSVFKRFGWTVTRLANLESIL